MFALVAAIVGSFTITFVKSTTYILGALLKHKGDDYAML